MIQTKKIQKWRIDSGVTNDMIAVDVGVTSPYVSMVIKGIRKSDAIVAAFIKRGCPAEYFKTYTKHNYSKNNQMAQSLLVKQKRKG